MNHAAARAARWVVPAFPLLLALVFVPALAAPFSASKTALFIFAAFMLAGLVALSKPDLPMRDGEGWLWCAILACVSVVALSAAVSPLRYLSGPGIAFIASGLLLFWAARFALAGNTRTLLYTASAAALIVALITVAQFFEINVLSSFGLASSDVHRMRMYSTLGNPDFVAAFLAAALPASLLLSLATRYQRAYGIASALVIALAILLTGSRAGVLALVAATVVFMIVAVEGRAARWCVCGAVLLLCAVAGTQRLNSRTAAESARGRVFIWQVTLSDGAALSAAGSGPGSFEYLYPARLGRFFSEPGHDESLRFAGHERHAQNDFVEAWSDTGWLGLVLVVITVGIWLWQARSRLRDAEASMRSTLAAAIAGVSALCVASMFDFPLHRAETWALLWLWMAVPFVRHEMSSARPRSGMWLRVCGAALLTVAGSYFAMATAASSYWLEQGQVHEQHGRTEMARDAYRSALRWDGSSPDANFNLVRAIAKAGDLSGAIAQSRLASRFVNEPELILLRSRIQQNAGRTDEAVSELQAGVRLFPYSQELRDELASCSDSKPSATGR